MQLLLLFAVELRRSALCRSLAGLIINLPIMLQISTFPSLKREKFKNAQPRTLAPDLLQVMIWIEEVCGADSSSPKHEGSCQGSGRMCGHPLSQGSLEGGSAASSSVQGCVWAFSTESIRYPGRGRVQLLNQQLFLPYMFNLCHANSIP